MRSALLLVAVLATTARAEPSVCLLRVADSGAQVSAAAVSAALEVALKRRFTVIGSKRVAAAARTLRLARGEWLTPPALTKLTARVGCQTPLVARVVPRSGLWTLELSQLDPATGAEGSGARVELTKTRLSAQRAAQLVDALELDPRPADEVPPTPESTASTATATPTPTPTASEPASAPKDEWATATEGFEPVAEGAPSTGAGAPSLAESVRLDTTVEVGGRVSFEHFAFLENRDAAKLGGRDAVEASLRVKAVHPRATAYASLLARVDFVDPSRNRFDPEEAWVDSTFPSVSVKVGRVIVAGGTASLYNPTDILNAVDLRDPLASVKLGALMVRATGTIGPVTLEATYLPVPESHGFPTITGIAPDGALRSPSRWVRGSIDPVGSVPVEYVIAPFQAPTPRPSNSQVALRVEVSLGGADLGLGYGYLVDRLPSPLVEAVSTPGDPTQNKVFIDWAYRRLHAITFDVERTFGRLRLAGEAAAFVTADPTARNPRVADPYLLTNLGGDLQSPEFLDGQHLHFFLEFAYAVALAGKLETEGLDSFRYPFPLTLLGRVSWEITTDLNVEVDAVSSLQRLDLLVSPRVEYQFFDRVRARVGFDFMAGSPTQGFFGPFARNSRFIATVEARF